MSASGTGMSFETLFRWLLEFYENCPYAKHPHKGRALNSRAAANMHRVGLAALENFTSQDLSICAQFGRGCAKKQTKSWLAKFPSLRL